MSSYDAESILCLSLTPGTSRRGFMDGVAAASEAAAATVRDMVGRCRLTVSKPVLKAPMVSAREATM